MGKLEIEKLGNVKFEIARHGNARLAIAKFENVKLEISRPKNARRESEQIGREIALLEIPMCQRKLSRKRRTDKTACAQVGSLSCCCECPAFRQHISSHRRNLA